MKKRNILYFLCSLFIINSSLAESIVPKISTENFLTQLEAQVSDRQIMNMKNVKKGDKTFIPVSALIRGQDEISVANVMAKLEEKISDKELSWDQKGKKWVAAFDAGKSATSLNDPVVVVLGPQGPVILDGHHETYLSLYVDAPNIAVEVKEDLSHLSPLDFWKELKKREWIILRAAPVSLAKKPPSLKGIRDNGNRYLASLLALKVSVAQDAGTASIDVKTKEAKNIAWMKVNDSVPFIEFKIAKVLSNAGIEYDSKWKKSIPEKIIEQSRKALWQAQRNGNFDSSIPLIRKSKEADKIFHSKSELIKFMKSNKVLPEDCKIKFKKLI